MPYSIIDSTLAAYRKADEEVDCLLGVYSALLRHPLTILIWIQHLDEKPPHLGRICPCDAGALEHTF
jgi:hypothetical protein